MSNTRTFPTRALAALITLLLLVVCSFAFTGCHKAADEAETSPESTIELPEFESDQQSTDAEDDSAKSDGSEDADKSATIDEDGTYTSKDEVALYIHTYGHLPSNFITKQEAKEAGWNSSQNTLAEVCPGMSIGGDRFGNYEGLLPDAKGRAWKECDINYKKGSRGAERILYSNDGLIYYTDDHYESFTQLY